MSAHGAKLHLARIGKGLVARGFGEDIELDAEDLADLERRPRTRGDCVGGQRPCPWFGCRYHIATDVNEDTGSMAVLTDELEQLVQTCALDVADDGHHTLDEVGELIGVTRERTRQIEVVGLLNLRRAGRRLVGGGQ